MSEFQPPAEFFTIRQFSQIAHLSEATIRRRIRDGSLPFVQPGGKRTKILIPADAFCRLATRKICAPEEVARDESQKQIPGRKPVWAKKQTP